jgi:hypothetical protein
VASPGHIAANKAILLPNGINFFARENPAPSIGKLSSDDGSIKSRMPTIELLLQRAIEQCGLDRKSVV